MNMIERVARAIDPEAFARNEVAKQFVESAGRTWLGSYEEGVHKKKLAGVFAKARAAVEAMRTPTEWMLSGNGFGDTVKWMESGPRDVWELMITAALSEGSSEA